MRNDAFLRSINVGMVCSESYTKPALVALSSLRKNTPKNIRINFYLISKIRDRKLSPFRKALSSDDTLNFLFIDPAVFGKVAEETGKRYGEAILRIFAPYFLKNKNERLLYMDADFLIVNNIMDFYDCPFSESEILAGTLDDGLSFPTQEDQCRRLGIPTGTYLNTGLTIIDIQKYTSLISLQKLIAFVNQNLDKFLFLDQDAVSLAFFGHIHFYLSYKYNYWASGIQERLPVSPKEKPLMCAYHFGGESKPWVHWASKSWTNEKMWWRYAFRILNPFWCTWTLLCKFLHLCWNRLPRLPRRNK